MNDISSTAKKIVVAALTETNPNSIAAATSLTVQTVYANLNNLKKHNLATYDSEKKTLTLTEEGIRVATENTEPTTISTSEPTFTVVVTGSAKKKDIAWAIIDAMLAEGNTRTEIIARLVAEMNILSNNASTYIQNHRKAHGLVTPRVIPVAATTEGEIGLGVDDVAEPIDESIDSIDLVVEDTTDV